MRLHKMPVLNFALVMAVVLLCAVSAAAVEDIAGIAQGDITPEEGRALIQHNEHLVIVDVRNHNEFIVAHYPNAINIPVTELEARLDEIPTGRPVLLHCARGIRSTRAYRILRENRPDITKLYNISGSPIF